MARDEVAALLDRAAGAGAQDDWQTVADLYCHLERAVPGACPSRDWPADERQTRLYSLLVYRYSEGGTPDLTAAVWAVLTEVAAGDNDG
jgi:hypothetical protein